MHYTLAIVIMMGGENKRMQGAHKAFLTFHEKPFWEVLSESLQVCGPIYLSVNHQKPYTHLPYPLIEDTYKGIGPLGGIYTALTSIPTDYIFVVGCDMPLVDQSVVTYLCSHLTPTTSCVVLKDEEGRLYPMAALYSKRLLPAISEQIEGENFRLRLLFDDPDACLLDMSDAPFSKDLFTNINTPEAYQSLFLRE